MAGGSPMSPIIARQLLVQWQARRRRRRRRRPRRPMRPLSPRETEVLGPGRPRLHLRRDRRSAWASCSVSTVQSHVRNIYGKLDVHNKTEAVFEARQLGLLR